MSLRSQLIRDEGSRATVYTDTRGNVTFGVGHKGSTPLTQAAIDKILDDDIVSHKADLFAAFPWMQTLSEVRQNVFINMCFNLGIAGLSKFKNTLTMVQKALDTDNNFKDAAEAMRNSLWAMQVGNRADRLATQLETDVEQ